MDLLGTDILFPPNSRKFDSNNSSKLVRNLLYCGAKNVVFMQCYHDSPEESRWVYETAQEHPFLKGIVAGLDVTKHDKLQKCIEEFQSDLG